MKRLFLDDIRIPLDCCGYMFQRGIDVSIYREDWHIVRSFGQFVAWIESNGLPDIISFDHDLGDDPNLKIDLPADEWFSFESGKEYTGMDCAKWLVEYCLDNAKKMPYFTVHYANPAGTENIKGLLENFNKNVSLQRD